jgi:hypothetical protein
MPKKLPVLERLALPSVRPLYAFAAALLVIVGCCSSSNLMKTSRRALRRYIKESCSGKASMARIHDAKQLRNQLSGAVNHRFAPIALDLSGIKLYPAGGFVEKIGDRQGAQVRRSLVLLCSAMRGMLRKIPRTSSMRIGKSTSMLFPAAN